eukprot:scaffold16982_cov91-Skeletonema_dohrnii-CCMP3373.AAC.2
MLDGGAEEHERPGGGRRGCEVVYGFVSQHPPACLYDATSIKIMMNIKKPWCHHSDYADC